MPHSLSAGNLDRNGIIPFTQINIAFKYRILGREYYLDLIAPPLYGGAEASLLASWGVKKSLCKIDVVMQSSDPSSETTL